MEVGEAILAVGAGERPASFEQFSAAIDPQWIAEALAATDTASVRRRKLPAEHVMWLVIGMGLFRDRSITQVVHHLDLVVPARRGERGRVSNAAIVQARDQLGAAPLAALFTQTATVWTTEAAATERWRGLAVYGLAGTTLRVPDTPENVTTFGRPGSPDGAGAGYPQVRVVALLNLRHHLLAAAAVGLLSHRRTRAGARGVGRAPRPRGGHPGPWLLQLRPVPCPERPDPRPPLARASPRRAHRRAAPNRRARRVGRCVGGAATDQHHLRQTPRPAAHAAGARRPGPAPRLPPLLALHLAAQPPSAPAAELAALYHERWELELAFDELKTHTLDRAEALRSKAPARVEQEVWGLLLAYNLVRLVMSRAAPRAGVPPVRLSYRHAR